MVDRILGLIEAKGISAYKFTSDLRLSSGAVSDWKKGRSKPGADAIVKIAKYFSVSTDYLLMGIEERNRPQARLTLNLKEDNGMDFIKIERFIRSYEKALRLEKQAQKAGWGYISKLPLDKLAEIENALNFPGVQEELDLIEKMDEAEEKWEEKKRLIDMILEFRATSEENDSEEIGAVAIGDETFDRVGENNKSVSRDEI